MSNDKYIYAICNNGQQCVTLQSVDVYCSKNLRGASDIHEELRLESSTSTTISGCES